MDILEDRAPTQAPTISSTANRVGVHREVRTTDGWWEAIRIPKDDGTYDYRLQTLIQPTAAWQANYDARAAASQAREAELEDQRTKLEQAKSILSQDPTTLTEAQFRRLVFRALRHILKGTED